MMASMMNAMMSHLPMLKDNPATPLAPRIFAMTAIERARSAAAIRHNCGSRSRAVWSRHYAGEVQTQ